MAYNTVIGDHILLSHYVRYERLTELINKEFHDSGYNEVNVFIDMYSMVKSIYKLDPSQFIDKFSIASCVINACAHYRNFFWTRYRVTCKIWVVFSRMEDSITEARAFYPGYSNVFMTDKNPSMDFIINENIKVLDSLCKYIPDVQFIHSTYEPALVFTKIATSPYGFDKPNFIISKDLWNLQVVGNYNNVFMIRPIKKNSGDESILICQRHVIEYYTNIRKVNSLDYVDMHSSFISFIIAATRFPERGMKSLHNLSSIIKYLKNAINKAYITNGKIYDLEGLCRDLNVANKANINSFEIGLRMNTIGLDACFYRYCMSPKSDSIDIINLHDPDSVKRINDKYFTKTPLDLMSL